MAVRYNGLKVDNRLIPGKLIALSGDQSIICLYIMLPILCILYYE